MKPKTAVLLAGITALTLLSAFGVASTMFASYNSPTAGYLSAVAWSFFIGWKSGELKGILTL